ncbi:hypothetical protein J437_LFUL018981 [Ladona fulva]|uniref:Uncharacterized protein n=1 Tax=Ladona fulva TaxID=123851 RepID=A0A8K0KWN3_LADFU|nr:hypothetical protein J437_LFUL018981 [Ladona fulva]
MGLNLFSPQIGKWVFLDLKYASLVLRIFLNPLICVKSVLKLLHCASCKNALVDEKSDYPFINFKNKGGLTIPSADVITICKLTEKCYRVLPPT